VSCASWVGGWDLIVISRFGHLSDRSRAFELVTSIVSSWKFYGLPAVSLFSVVLFFFILLLLSLLILPDAVLLLHALRGKYLSFHPYCLGSSDFIASHTDTVLHPFNVGWMEYLVVNQVEYLVAFSPQNVAALAPMGSKLRLVLIVVSIG
jgi:hypothetical protein